MSGERWRPVLGFEGIFEVSDMGRVRRIATGHVWAAHRTGSAYPTLHLRADGKSRTAKVHALVCEAFLGPKPPGMVVRHLDGDEDNNALTNLCYGTQSENNRDKRAHGTDHNLNKTHCPQGHPYSPENTRVSRSRRECRTCLRIRKRRTPQAVAA